MKKRLSRLMAGCCALALLVSIGGASAAATQDIPVHGEFWQGYPLWLDNVAPGFFNEKKTTVRLVQYNGTIYIPLRTAGEWMGCEVVWDQQAQTVKLTSGGTPVVRDRYDPTADKAPSTEEESNQYILDRDHGFEMLLRPDLTITLDGKRQTFANAKGEPVHPVVFREVVYLPMRNIGELCGKEVTWLPPLRTTTPGQNAEGTAYMAACVEIYGAIIKEADALAAAEGLDNETALARVNAFGELILSLTDLPKPSAPILQASCADYVDLDARLMVVYFLSFYISELDGSVPQLGKVPWDNIRARFGESVRDELSNSVVALKIMQQVVDGLCG